MNIVTITVLGFIKFVGRMLENGTFMKSISKDSCPPTYEVGHLLMAVEDYGDITAGLGVVYVFGIVTGSSWNDDHKQWEYHAVWNDGILGNLWEEHVARYDPEVIGKGLL